MNKKIILTMILLIPMLANSQHRFSNLYDNLKITNTKANDLANDILQFSDSTFLVSAITYDNYAEDTLNIKLTYLQYFKIGPKGDTIANPVFKFKNSYIGARHRLLAYDSVNTFAFVSFLDIVKYHNTGYSFDILMLKLTKFGDTLWTKKIVLGEEFEYISNVFKTNDNQIAIAGQRCNIQSTDCDNFLLKIDTNGNVLFNKNYSYSKSSFEQCAQVYQAKNSNYYFWSNTQSIYTASNMGFLQKLDVNGNVIKTKLFGNFFDSTLDLRSQGMVSIADTAFVLVGARLFEEWSSSLNGWILKVDTNFNVIWEKQFGNKFGSFSNVVYFKNRIFVQGHKEHDLAFITSEIWFLCFDPNGDTLWQRFYPWHDPIHGNGTIYKFIKTYDNGFAFTGFMDNQAGPNYNQSVWVLKVDSLGCLLANCSITGIANAQVSNYFKVYPNPAYSEINLSANFFIKTVQLYNLLGKLVYQTQQFKNEAIDVSSLPKGIYVLKVIDDGFREYVQKVLVE